jgi:DNA-binding MarR family transcriptional regulator
MTQPDIVTDADYRALHGFRCQIRRFLSFSEQAARLHGLEPQQHQMLLAIRALNETAGSTVGNLAECLVVKHHSAVGLVDRLAARGLVERVRAGEGDRRQVRVRLTELGAERLESLSSEHRAELGKSGPLLVESLASVLRGAGVRQ